jgi:alanine racemase
LASNYKLIKKRVGNTKIMSVVKGDAYGHGMKECVKIFHQNGSKEFYVARLEDAIEIRRKFKQVRIYLLSGVVTSKCCDQIIKFNIIPIINNFDQLNIIENYSKKIKYVLHIDTGMNRLGFHINNVEKLNEKVSVNNILFIMSHLSSSDDKDTKECKLQLSKLKNINKYFKKPMSIANSAGIFLGKPFYLDYVRPGKSLYGINPFINKTFGLKPAMSIYAPILQVSNLKKGKTIGYSKTYRANREMKVATIDFGYSDGYLRSGSNKGKFFINNISCNILGRVSMDLITIDVSQLKDDQLYIGKPVEILGQNQTYADLAYETKTNEHEILISLGKNSKKVYI